MSNAFGRLLGTLISGYVYQYTVGLYGMSICLWTSSAFLVLCILSSLMLRPYLPAKGSSVTASV